MLLVLFQVLSVVVKDEREVVVQVDLKQTDRETKISRRRETTRKLLWGPTLGTKALPLSNRPAVPTVQKQCSHSCLSSDARQSSLGFTRHRPSPGLTSRAFHHLTVIIF